MTMDESLRLPVAANYCPLGKVSVTREKEKESSQASGLPNSIQSRVSSAVD